MRVALVPLLMCACFDIQPRAQYCAETPTPPPLAKSGISYFQDVQPILNTRCGACHQGQGPGPMRLTDWDDVHTFAGDVYAAVQSRHMPPWPPARCCAEYERSFALTDDEVATVEGWHDQGFAMGTPVDAGVPARLGLPRIDATASMDGPFLPQPPEGRTDQTRCFLLKWAPEQTVYITGLDIRPGFAPQMHHGLVVVASEDDAVQLQKLDDASPGEGWDCPGGLVGYFKSSLGGSFFEAQTFATGLGVEMQPTDRLVLTMHYSVPALSSFEQDQTNVQLMFQTMPTKPLIYISVFNPSWLVGGMEIPAGLADYGLSYADEPTLYNGGKAYDIRAVNIHMHERGHKGQVTILRGDGSRECLLQIDNWDPGHQGDYVLKTPKRLNPGDRVMVECRWDNSATHQRVVNGTMETPRTLWWAEDQEMCVAFLTASLAE
jgi:hypothetical protein